jgi:hypothetical protein
VNPITYLYDDAAIDVSRITGIPWAYEQFETRGARRPCINLVDLDWWDRMRVALTVIAAEYLIDSYMISTTLESDGDPVLASSVAPSVPDRAPGQEDMNAA